MSLLIGLIRHDYSSIPLLPASFIFFTLTPGNFFFRRAYHPATGCHKFQLWPILLSHNPLALEGSAYELTGCITCYAPTVSDRHMPPHLLDRVLSLPPSPSLLPSLRGLIHLQALPRHKGANGIYYSSS